MRKRILIISGIAVLVLLLAGAAFVGGKMLSGPGLVGLTSPGDLTAMLGGQGVKHAVRVGDILPAKELPQTPADAKGLFDHRQDNIIFVGTGQTNISVEGGPGGQLNISANHTGPVVEVVVGTRTAVYRDVTDENWDNLARVDGKIRQVVEPGSLDQAGQYSLITVWGKKTGERITAEVLVYTLPPTLNAP